MRALAIIAVVALIIYLVHEMDEFYIEYGALTA